MSNDKNSGILKSYDKIDKHKLDADAILLTDKDIVNLRKNKILKWPEQKDM